jgi:hypothetical protein
MNPGPASRLSDVELERQLSELSSLANSAAANGVAVPQDLEAQFLELQAEQVARKKRRAPPGA